MAEWLCATCAVETTPIVDETGEHPPAACPICEDERQYVPPTGQEWTTLQRLQRDGERVVVTELEPDLYGLRSEPRVGIGQQALLLCTPDGNLLWDPTGYVDEAAATVPVLNLNLAKAKVTVGKKHLTVSNVKGRLTGAAAGALNTYYGTSLFKGGLKIGTATVKASIKILHG